MTRTLPDDPARKWRTFTTAIMAVLAGTTVAVLLVVMAVAAVQLGGMARDEQRRKAGDMAAFLARSVYVSVSLEDAPAVEAAAALLFDDPDVVSVAVFDAAGRPMVHRRRPERARGPALISASRSIRSAASRGDARPVGRVDVAVSPRRAYGVVRGAVAWIVAAAGLVLLAAVAADLALIRRMTGRLQELVGEAKLAEDLRRSNKELEAFAFVASHDLQEPLRKIVNYSELLRRRYEGSLDADALRYIETIVAGGERMSRLIQDLLSYSRVGTQGKPLAPVDAQAVAREVVSVMSERIKEAGADVQVGPLPRVLADAGQLEQLLRNLVANAVKFRGEAAPVVRISASPAGAFWRFTVSDNGIGIDPQYRKLIFEMFKRLHGRDAYPGTGIGLSICKKIVERHGGRIWVESNQGPGCAFHFTLRAA